MVMKYLAEVRSRMSADSMQVLRGSDVNMMSDDGIQVFSGCAVQDEC